MNTNNRNEMKREHTTTSELEWPPMLLPYTQTQSLAVGLPPRAVSHRRYSADVEDMARITGVSQWGLKKEMSPDIRSAAAVA
jgi:hypothetical protein